MISILGGTGPEGQGLALRFAQAGYSVIIGSRDEDRAKQAAKDIGVLINSDLVTGNSNKEAAEFGSTVFISLPYVAQRETLLELRPSLEGKTVVDVIAPNRDLAYYIVSVMYPDYETITIEDAPLQPDEL